MSSERKLRIAGWRRDSHWLCGVGSRTVDFGFGPMLRFCLPSFSGIPRADELASHASALWRHVRFPFPHFATSGTIYPVFVLPSHITGGITGSYFGDEVRYLFSILENHLESRNLKIGKRPIREKPYPCPCFQFSMGPVVTTSSRSTALTSENVSS